MCHKFQLREGAILISDAHYSPSRPELLNFLYAIEAKKLTPPQLIFMGDIFDELFGSIDYTYRRNREMIQLIESLSQQVEILYLEGNHDFNLKKIFKNIQIVPIGKQPFSSSFNDKQVLLAHGDFDAKIGYKIYTALIRNPIVLFFLKYIDIALEHKILKSVEAHLSKKDDCKRLEWFEDFIKRRFDNRHNCDYFIEGHFHQNKRLHLKDFDYINLGAFACNQRYFIVKSTQDNNLVVEENIYKEM
jgi:UDP-2,3-diacylglucosamine hydrolase